MIYEELLKIGSFILESFLHIWPYLLVTIPLAVAIQMSGASKYIKGAFGARPFIAIVLATVVGAFSPFCSCGVIPVIASLLISGVPLAPVMSFWIASPSMDPEIFFLSVGMIGWELAVWRLAATLLLSFGAGLLTHVIMQRGWLRQPILRSRKAASVQSTFELIKKGWNRMKAGIRRPRPATHPEVSIGSDADHLMQLIPVWQTSSVAKASAGAPVCRTCSSDAGLLPSGQIPIHVNPSTPANKGCCSSRPAESNRCDGPTSIKHRLVKETLNATWMVGKFMGLAFLLEGVITLYVPGDWITAALGGDNPLAILTAAMLGVPAYTTSLTALPMISGLLTQGMNPAAAIAFLIAGPTTTLPAMAAVWPLVSRRVFVLYVSFSLAGAVLAGYTYSLVASLH
jgi:uncharacterized membrane protein YraQ (UPF0718 family)